ncbi:LysR family transcriptional regulator [Saccharopolyspora dendranthemae]|uniref:DNA-binding transcriptional LysR family regulator n=1 Tax=Saccharopolyspora dendranthemae TaxID=1181886 RepID=A0A561U1Z7_9PSEU|nr:LysR substrate-binding domain-containing protein [Saccharopolyspora dendranthemae]TWF93350.1 DNA-binding transcriptional LysR family regulator [Saccharopolyspora dendranthemae]
MDLRQLEYFVAVAEERNFTRAAQRVHISQSGVSAQIRRLEKELGAELFDRSARSAELTVAGEAALAHARNALAAAASVGQAVGEITGLLRGNLSIGMVIGCTVTPLFDALAGFHRAHPGVTLSLREDNSDRLLDDVRSGALDLALIGTGTEPDDLEFLTIISEPLVAAVPAGHELAGGPVALHDLAAHPVVCMPPGTGLRAVFDRVCAARGVEPMIALQASAAEAIADLALRGLGVAILSESMVAGHSGLTALPLADAIDPALLVLAWRPGTNAAARELIAYCRTAFRISADQSSSTAPTTR